MAIAFTGVVCGKRDYVHVNVDGTKYTFATKYQENITSERVSSEKWNGSAYERIHRVIRAWKNISFSTGRMKGTYSEVETFVTSLLTSSYIYIAKTSTATAPTASAPVSPWLRVTLEDTNLDINDAVMQRGNGIALNFKHSVEV